MNTKFKDGLKELMDLADQHKAKAEQIRNDLLPLSENPLVFRMCEFILYNARAGMRYCDYNIPGSMAEEGKKVLAEMGMTSQITAHSERTGETVLRITWG
jgi:hypothetical protein